MPVEPDVIAQILEEERKKKEQEELDALRPVIAGPALSAPPELGKRLPGETTSELVARITRNVDVLTPQPEPAGRSLTGAGVFDPAIRQNYWNTIRQVVNQLFGVEDLPAREDLPPLFRPRL
jgi:hypothetical protein